MGYDAWEKYYTPLSIVKLNAATADRLKRLMADVSAGCPIGSTFVNDVVFIWLVDSSGAVLVAIEELVVDKLPQGVPKFQSTKPLASADKLGHPSLVLGSKARIAGEVLFIPDKALWSINNKSWRYGLYDGRTSAQLDAVAAEFRGHGIDLRPDFIEPK